MDDAPTDLVPTSEAPPPGLSRRRWSLHGAALGLAATAGVSAIGAMALSHQGFGAAAFAALALSAPAAALGAFFGRRWKRWVARDAHTVPVSRWFGRMSSDGAFFAGGSAMASLTLLGLGLGRGDLAGFASAIGFVGLIAVPAGALTMAAVGLPFLVSLGRGRRPWVALGLAAVLAPPAVIASVVGALALMQLFV